MQTAGKCAHGEYIYVLLFYFERKTWHRKIPCQEQASFILHWLPYQPTPREGKNKTKPKKSNESNDVCVSKSIEYAITVIIIIVSYYSVDTRFFG